MSTANPPVTLPTAPPEHPALDFARLRSEGIQHIARMAGHLWTDYNAHDPGITILEQLCYAITDLSYRTSHSISDLIVEDDPDPYPSLYSPATILSSEPVTLLDLRKLVLDVDGVRNAWIELLGEQQPALYFHEGRKELTLRADDQNIEPVRLMGLYRVVIEKSELSSQHGTTVERAVARKLHAHRGLCEDFEEIKVLAPVDVRVHANIEIGPIEDADEILVAIYQAISDYLSPSVEFATLDEMLARGKRVDEVFDGPLLEHGFLDDDALAKLRRRTNLYASDLVNVLMDLPGVRAVRDLSIARDDDAPEAWTLKLGPDRVPRLVLMTRAQGDASRALTINLLRDRLAVSVDEKAVTSAYTAWLVGRAIKQPLAREQRDIVMRPGVDRDVARYYSIQQQFPAAYGIGAMGLAETASPERKARAQQLKAYLMFFDQLLANYFAQLAASKHLFSYSDANPQTYRSQLIDDPTLKLDEVWRGSPMTAAELQAMTERATTPGNAARRKDRFVNHLMARFAEDFTDYSLVLFGAMNSGQEASDAAQVRERLCKDKLAFLRGYPEASSARGRSFNYLERWGDTNMSGLERRIRLKLGLKVARGEDFRLVEHILLRPIPEDRYQTTPDEFGRLPLLAATTFKDPYSLQLSFAFPSWPERLKSPAFRELVEQTVRAETPAHLTPTSTGSTAPPGPSSRRPTRAGWRYARTTGPDKRGVLYAMASSDSKHLDVRDSRDRIIDLLGLGETYPLRDVAVSKELKVAYNKPTAVSVNPAQRGVKYELRDINGDGPAGDLDGPLTRAVNGEPVAIEATGAGVGIELTTDAIVMDRSFRVLAQKLHPLPDGELSRRDAYLIQTTSVKVGLDTGLVARVVVDAETVLLSPGEKGDTAARLIEYGASVFIDIVGAQEGVDYRLVTLAADDAETVLSTDDVRGLGEKVTIRLTSAAIFEDVELKIRATKTYTQAEGRQAETALLDTLLPLKVRADRAVTVAVQGSPLVAHDGGATIVLGGTQASASYSLFIHRVRDHEYLRQERPQALHVSVPVDGGVVNLSRPPRTHLWSTPAQYAQVGAPRQGNGAELQFSLAKLTEDTLVLVRATKTHAAKTPIDSTIPVTAACAVLVRPNPAPGLAFEATVDPRGNATDGRVRVTGGQPGVFYQLRRAPDGDDLGRPAYFHQLDETNPQENKGISQLAIGVDFAVGRAHEPDSVVTDKPATTRPERPEVITGPLTLGTSIHVLARKAMSGLTAPLTRAARFVLPDIRPATVGVAAGQPASVEVLASDAADRYQLKLGDVAVGAPKRGDGDKLVFTSGAITRDETFHVHVTPVGGADLPLHRIVPVVVPLLPRSDLAARVDGPRLEPDNPVFSDADPKLIDFGGAVTVEVDATQRDVLYTLEYDEGNTTKPLSLAPVRGTGQMIKLQTSAVREDIDVRVLATRLFYPEAENRAQPTRRLTAILPLKVRPNRDVGVAVDQLPAGTYGQAASVTISDSQASASYGVYARALSDADFLYSAPTDPELAVLTVDIGDGARARVVRPELHALWRDLAGFSLLGGMTPGNGGAVKLPVPNLVDDLVIVIKAHKEHAIPGDTVPSDVQVVQAALVLVKPNADPGLALRVAMTEATTDGAITLLNGEPGALYQLAADDSPLGELVYFHKRDASDPDTNKGLDQLRLGVDFVVAGDGPTPPADNEARIKTAPPPPVVTTGALEAPKTVTATATRARTGIATPLAKPARLLAVPRVVAVKATVSAGEKAQIEVSASAEGERYELTRDGVTIDARAGDGADLLLESDALSEDAAFEVVVRRDAPGELVVERIVRVSVTVEAGS